MEDLLFLALLIFILLFLAFFFGFIHEGFLIALKYGLEAGAVAAVSIGILCAVFLLSRQRSIKKSVKYAAQYADLDPDAEPDLTDPAWYTTGEYPPMILHQSVFSREHPAYWEYVKDSSANDADSAMPSDYYSVQWYDPKLKPCSATIGTASEMKQFRAFCQRWDIPLTNSAEKWEKIQDAVKKSAGEFRSGSF